jgi:hypothetical protein
MIRKVLLIGAAVAMPVTVLSAVSFGVGTAGAKGTPVAETCATAGSVTFAKPGLSHDGSTTTKTSETTKPTFGSVAGDPASCSTKPIKLTVTTATTPCTTTSPPPPASCTAPKAKPNYYNTTAGFASSSTTAAIYAALQPGLKTKDNGANIVLNQPPSSSDVSSVLPGGACGANKVGFQVTNGTVTDSTGSVHNWSSLTCITTDTTTGTGGTGDFYTDLLASAGGNNNFNITSATFGGNSALTIS